MHEKSSLGLILEAAAIIDIGYSDLDLDPYKVNHDFSDRIQDAGILGWINELVFDTEEFRAASTRKEHEDPIKEVRVRRGEYEYAFSVPLKNSSIRRFVRISLSNPKNKLSVVLTQGIVELKEEREKNVLHLWNCDAALWAVSGVINEFNLLAPTVRTTFPASV